MPIRSRWLVSTLGLCLVLATSMAAAPDAAEQFSGIRVPAEPTPIMTLDQVRVGMTGYGLTVFHGDKIEPFPVVVQSVVSDSSAKRGTIWIICTDERMTRSGPVQGMSGSPIYLWNEGEAGTPGEGGQLIGAFAFGYSDVNVCLVGVQPIEYMREVGQRAEAEDLTVDPVRQAPAALAGESLRTLAGVIQSRADAGGGVGLTLAASRLSAVSQLLAGRRGLSQTPPAVQGPARGPATHDGLQALQLPLRVSDADTAAILQPLLAPAGLHVMAGEMTAVAGKPPSNVKPASVKIQPGAVLSIPLAFGDLDLNAAGTVTDVLPDGTVLAFGHAMNSAGPSRLPMATGYTHFVVSRTSISFKQAGSLDIVGSIVRDEASAVSGRPDNAFHTAPVSIHIEQATQPARSYQYQVVDHLQLTPAIVAALVNQSLNAVQGTPLLHTLHISGQMTFTGGRTLELDSTLAGGGMNNLAFELMPPLIALMQNPFDPLRLDAADLTIRIEPQLREAELLEARVARYVVQPGDKVEVLVRLQPFNRPSETHNISLQLPANLPEGDYPLIISGADQATQRYIASHPNLTDIDNIDELAGGLQELARLRSTAIYAALPWATPSLALNGQPLPALPGSRAAMLVSEGLSTAQPYQRFVETVLPVDWIVSGDIDLMLRVQKKQP